MQAKKTILHVFPTFGVGGSQMRTIMLARAFGDEYHHDIMAMDGRFEATELLDGIDWSPVKMAASKHRLVTNVLTFRRALRQYPPHALITYNWGAIEWAVANWTQRIPHIHAEDGFGPDEAAGQLPRRVWFRRFALAGKRLVVPSLTLEKLVREQWKIPRIKLHVVPLGIDIVRFDGPQDREITAQWGSDEDGPLIGTIAALRPEKRLDRLLRAFARLLGTHPARLVIVGGGPERSGLEAMVRQLKIDKRVYFAGFVANPERVIGAFDLFALSSDTEQMPTSVLEAMAAGLPVAATDVGDTRHMVAEANKALVSGHNADALAASLEVLVADGDLRKALGRDNHARAKAAFSLENMLARWHALYEGQ